MASEPAWARITPSMRYRVAPAASSDCTNEASTSAQTSSATSSAYDPTIHDVTRADLFGGLEIEARGEDREPAVDTTGRRLEQPVAPVQRPLQRPVPLGKTRIATAQHGRRTAQATEDLAGADRAGSGRGQLDGEWQPGELDDTGRPRRRAEAVGVAGRPQEEEQHAGVDLGVDSKRFEAVDVFRDEPERGPARRQDTDTGAERQNIADERCHALGHVLAVVEDDERGSVLEVSEDLLPDVLPGRDRGADREGDRRRHVISRNH